MSSSGPVVRGAHRARRGRRPRRAAAALVALGTALAVATVVLVVRHEPPGELRPVVAVQVPVGRGVAPTPPAHPATAAVPTLGPLSRTAARLLHVRPVDVEVPALGIRSPLVDLGLNPDRTLQAPTDYGRAGWYAGGSYPGDADGPPAVVAGHVDSWDGPAVFFPLHRAKAGQQVRVRRSDGSVAVFVVYATREYPKDAFPADAVYAPTERAELRLITCIGEFDDRDRSYTDNFVVFAALDPALSESAP